MHLQVTLKFLMKSLKLEKQGFLVQLNVLWKLGVEEPWSRVPTASASSLCFSISAIPETTARERKRIMELNWCRVQLL